MSTSASSSTAERDAATLNQVTHRLPASHTLALQSAIGSPDVARAAWSAWRDGGHIADVEVRRLMAMIASNLARVLPDDIELATIHAERRRTLVRQVHRLKRCQQIAEALRTEGVDSLFFKGTGLLSYYPDRSVRTMWDADLLVPWHRRHDSIDVLTSRGFTPVYGRDVESMHRLTDSNPGWGMHHDDGTEVDLHWRPLPHLRDGPGMDEQLFALARPASVASIELAVPDPSHHLVLVLAHGMRSTSEARLIAIADACRLLGTTDFDPDRAAQLAHSYERTSSLIAGCTILERLLDVDPDTGRLGPGIELSGPVSALRRSLRARTMRDRLYGREVNARFGAATTRAQVAREAWEAAAVTPLRKGGPVTGLIDVGRRRIGAPRKRNIPGELLWVAAGRPAVLERLRGEHGTPAADRPILSIGDQVLVGRTQHLSNLLAAGWWPAEDDSVWSRGRVSVIDFDLNLGPSRSCNVALVVTPFLSEAHPVLSVDVRVNHRQRATWVYGTGQEYELTQRVSIPEATLDGHRCQITLIVREASSPLASGMSNDGRVLGLSLKSLTIEPIGVAPVAVDATVRDSLVRSSA
ncbi:MAG: hypothetical protein JWN99_2236 [Ilumatobacteraceae bacterium]|nr:hypothetical protein [Ilumatobacteraceae bacterium]